MRVDIVRCAYCAVHFVHCSVLIPKKDILIFLISYPWYFTYLWRVFITVYYVYFSVIQYTVDGHSVS